jgi:hypothetical protein
MWHFELLLIMWHFELQFYHVTFWIVIDHVTFWIVIDHVTFWILSDPVTFWIVNNMIFFIILTPVYNICFDCKLLSMHILLYFMASFFVNESILFCSLYLHLYFFFYCSLDEEMPFLISRNILMFFYDKLTVDKYTIVSMPCWEKINAYKYSGQYQR